MASDPQGPCGQAYVALSRVRTLSRLIIRDFADKAIFCNARIKDAIQSMPIFLTENMTRPIKTNTFSVFLMNVKSLSGHVADLKSCAQHLQPNCIAVTETWLPADSSLESVQIEGFSFHSCSSSVSYTNSYATQVELQGQQHGGVG